MTTKAEGQQLSLSILSDQASLDFLRIIRDEPRGRFLTVNTLRDRLDAAGIPESARGALMVAACRAGYIEPVVRRIGGLECELRVVSTNPGSRGSSVRLYRRAGTRRSAR